MLIHNQKEISSNIIDNIKLKMLYSIPTGAGKTYILLNVAKTLREKHGLKVIISTSTNQLVNEFFTVSQEHFKMSDEVKISIGKDNYIDFDEYQYYRKTQVLNEYISENSLEKYDNYIAKKDKDQLLFYEFENIIELTDIASIKYIKELITKKKSNENKFQGNITITNHFYLITSLKNIEKEFFDEYILLTDETHLIGEVAKTVLSKNFSIFSTKIALQNIKKELDKTDDFVGKEALKKNIQTISASAGKLINRYSESSLVGLNSDEHKLKHYTEKIKNFNENDAVIKLKKQISKHADKFSRNSTILLNELQSINSLLHSYDTDPKYVNLSFTPSRGYPLLSSYSENPLGFLNRLLWSKVNYYAGVSATIAPSLNPNNKELNYAFKRLGMLGETDDIIFYPKVFPRELVTIFLPQKDAPDFKNVYDDGFDERDSAYHNYVVDYIHKNHHNKNSIVFCGGYKEAEIFSNLYSSLYDDVTIHCANKNQTSHQTLKSFKEEGGLLFATRDYGTGVTLKGKLLENIFFLRLPYPVTNSYYWQNLLKKSKNLFMSSLNFEMLINLMQFLGRLQRSINDSGSIHLLDKRYTDSIRLRSKIRNILEYYGVVQEEIEVQKKANKNMITEKDLDKIDILDSLL